MSSSSLTQRALARFTRSDSFVEKGIRYHSSYKEIVVWFSMDWGGWVDASFAVSVKLELDTPNKLSSWSLTHHFLHIALDAKPYLQKAENMFKITDCKMRIAIQQDKADLVEISKGIWDGHDYLPNILDNWLSEPWFFVCEYHGKVIACLKLSMFPDNVLWFEGLRVHAKYQGNGIATFMNKEAMRFALDIRQQNPALKFEFCTYYKNVESLHVTNKLGFKPVEKFYNLDKRGVKRVEKPEILHDYPFSIFKAFPRYLPLNWHAVHCQEQSLPFIRAHSEVFRTPQATYLVGTAGERCITFLSPPPPKINSELPYFQYFYGSRKKISIILPRAYVRHIGNLQRNNFFFWDESRTRALNMLVLSI